MRTTVEEALRSAADVRPAEHGDAVNGSLPTWVAEVTGTEQVAAVLRAAAGHGLRVVPRGAGSKLDWGAAPDGVDLVVDLTGVSGILEHAAGDLVLRVRAGTPLRDVHRALRASGQQLAIDHPLPEATAGGVIATALSGPGRHYFGGVRDLLIGVTAVLADGTVATSGGKVVKNVAGYDLGRLYTGSFGTLGVITEAVFRLHPLPAERRWVSVPSADLARVLAVLRRSQAMPTAIELDRPGPDGEPEVCVRLDGRAETTTARAEELAASLRGVSEPVRVLDEAPEWWGRLPFDPAKGVGIRIGASPAAVPDVLDALRAAGGGAAVRGAVGLGVLHAGLPGDTDPAVVAEWVRVARSKAAYAVVERGPAAVRARVDPWGPVDPGVLTLMRRTKNQFDPERRLAPGRFVGGI